jgi:hypothetical protein
MIDEILDWIYELLQALGEGRSRTPFVTNFLLGFLLGMAIAVVWSWMDQPVRVVMLTPLPYK